MVEAVPVCDQLALTFPCRVHDMSHHVSCRLSAKMCKSLEMICTSPNGTACRHDSHCSLSTRTRLIWRWLRLVTNPKRIQYAKEHKARTPFLPLSPPRRAQSWGKGRWGVGNKPQYSRVHTRDPLTRLPSSYLLSRPNPPLTPSSSRCLSIALVFLSILQLADWQAANALLLKVNQIGSITEAACNGMPEMHGSVLGREEPKMMEGHHSLP